MAFQNDDCDKCSKKLKDSASKFAYKIHDYHYKICIECMQIFKNIYDEFVVDFMQDTLPEEYAPDETCLQCEKNHTDMNQNVRCMQAELTNISGISPELMGPSEKKNKDGNA